MDSSPSASDRRQDLERARAAALQALQRACDRRHRADLERTVARLDDAIARWREQDDEKVSED